MALKDRSRFGGGRVAVPNLGAASQAFAQVGALAAGEQDRLLKEKLLLDKQTQLGIENLRADEALSLDAARREQDLGLREAEVQATSDYRLGRIAQADKAFAASRGDVRYQRGVEEGGVIGAGLPITEMEIADMVTTTLDKDLLSQQYKELTGTIGGTDKERQQAWINYQKTNVPGYEDAVPLYEQAADAAKYAFMAGPRLAIGGADYLRDALATKSQAQRDAEALGKDFAPKEVKPLTRDEFMSGLTQDDKAAKEAVKDFLKGDVGYQKEIGALKESIGTGMKRIDRDRLFAEIDTGAAQYAADYKARTGSVLPKSQMIGILRAGYANVQSIMVTRATSDTAAIKAFNKIADTKMKEAFKVRLEKIKRVPTALDKANLAKIITEEKLKSQTYEANRGLFDFD